MRPKNKNHPIKLQIVGGPIVHLSKQRYNNLDWLLEKEIGVKPNGAGLQSIDYGYNGRGWLTRINDLCEQNLIVDDPETPTMDEDFAAIISGKLKAEFKATAVQGKEDTYIRLEFTRLTELADGTTQEVVESKYASVGEPLGTPEFTNVSEINFIGEPNPEILALFAKGDIIYISDSLLMALGLIPVLDELYEERILESIEGELLTDRDGEQPCDDGDLFAERMYYNEGNTALGAAPQFNGNISQVRWTALNRPVEAFGYTYDQLDRLTLAKYGRYNSTGNVVLKNRYNEQLGYADKLGNIAWLKRNTQGNSNQIQPIDDLDYEYDSYGRLAGITESSDISKGYKGDGGHYHYDAMGNMTLDENKSLTVVYNFLNLPATMTINGGTMQVLYDADGQKHHMAITKPDNTVETRHYVEGIEYTGTAGSEVVESIYHEEGRVKFNSPFPVGQGYVAAVFEYTLRDHLGNTQVTFTDTDGNGDVTISEVTDEHHYYAFGLEMESVGYINANNNQYRKGFNGIEKVEELGLEWDMALFRSYDASVGRWWQVDPKCESFAGMSAYTGMGNNPILFADMLGDSIPAYFYDSEGKQVSEIPAMVQAFFNEEYGIVVGYEAATHMLYKVSNCKAEGLVSASGTVQMEGVLNATNSSTALITGYNLYVEGDGYDKEAVRWGALATADDGKEFAVLDLADFEDNGQLKYLRPNAAFDRRSMNIARTFEHEFFGHGQMGFGMEPNKEPTNVNWLNETFCRDADTPFRQGYTMTFNHPVGHPLRGPQGCLYSLDEYSDADKIKQLNTSQNKVKF